MMVYFHSLPLLLSIVTENSFVPQKLDIKATFLDSKLKATIYTRLPESYRDANKVAHLKKCVYGLIGLTMHIWKDHNMRLLTRIQTDDDIR
jgi:hypothetical protein